MPPLRWRPKITHGVTVFQLSLAMRPWSYVSEQVGGGDRTASGVPEAYEIRRDHGAVLRLRCTEAEWPDVRTWLEVCQGGAIPARVQFDRDDESTDYLVWVVRPRAGEPIPTPSRGRYPGELEVGPVEIHTTDGSPIDLPVFG